MSDSRYEFDPLDPGALGDGDLTPQEQEAAEIAEWDQDEAATREQQHALASRAHEVYQQILARAPEHDLVPTLDRMQNICMLMGDPQASFDSVHVTGTNGKTSTTRIIERLLRETGLRTGRFLSPHLVDVRERIALDGEPISAARFVDVFDEVLPYVYLADGASEKSGGPAMTFFEVLVALAFAAFADNPIDVGVVEVGMGGSWDATNVMDGKVAVIMPIDIDHVRFLGHDILDIAAEKAGIIKPGSTVIIGVQQPEVMDLLLERAAEVGAQVKREGIDFGVVERSMAVGGQSLHLRGLQGEYRDLFLPLHGAYQSSNAACALAAVEAFLEVSSDDGLTPGLALDVVQQAFAEVDSPGRMEVVRRSPTIVVDAAHNPAGARALADTVREEFNFSRLIGVVGILEDKDAEEILRALEPILDGVVITASTSSRSISPDELGEIAMDIFDEERVRVMQRTDVALEEAVRWSEEDLEPGAGVLVTGSITLVGDARQLVGLP